MKYIMVLVLLFIFSACTDYAGQMEDDFEGWKVAQSQRENVESSSSLENSVESSSMGPIFVQVQDEAIEVNSGDSFVLDASINQEDVEIEWFSWDCQDTSGNTLETELVKYDYNANGKSFKVEKNSSYSEKGLDMFCIVSVQESKGNIILSDTTIVRLVLPDVENKPLIDSRDGQIYETVVIGPLTWMAENLNYETEDSFCYNDSASYCARFGRLYTWDAAITACPSGWHLASNEDFDVLLYIVNNAASEGTMLRSTRGWSDYCGNGTDDFSFSLLPAGFRDSTGEYSDVNRFTELWSSTVYEDMGTIHGYKFCKGITHYHMSPNLKKQAFSVRCVKNYKTNPSVKNEPGEPLADSRDGQTYKTIVIGTQTWMAENLNYETENSFCYNDSASYCDKYGRLYTWAAAMKMPEGVVLDTMNIVLPYKGICPDGWHLPADEEFKTLIMTVGDQSTAGKMLKSTGGWNDYNGYHRGNGIDDYSFTALPAGSRSLDGSFNSEGNFAFFWSSTESDAGHAFFMELTNDHDDAFLERGGKDYLKTAGSSVRCVKD